MELGILDVFGINEACEIALLKYEDIKLQLSPKYQENSFKLLSTGGIYKIGGHSDGFKKVLIDITDSYKTNIMNIRLEDCEHYSDDY